MLAEDAGAISEPLLRSFRQFADEQGEDRLALAACVRGGGRSVHARARCTNCACPRWSWPVRATRWREARKNWPAIIPGAQAVTLPGCDHFSAIPHALFKASVFDFLEGTLGL